MRNFIHAAFLLLLSATSWRLEAAEHDQARALVSAALKAEGGEALLRSLRTVRLKALSVTNALEQSVRPEGPWFENHVDLIETRSFEPARMLTETRSRGSMSSWFAEAKWVPSVTLIEQGAAFAIAGENIGPARQALVPPAEESLALGPERALLTAMAAADLHIEADREFRGRKHKVIGFTWSGSPVRIFILPEARTPVAIEIERAYPRDMLFAPWGEMKVRTEWDAWTLEPNGLHYPRRWVRWLNGQVLESRMIDEVQINPTETQRYTISREQVESAKARNEAQAIATFKAPKPIQVAPSVALYEGAWNFATIDVGDSTYILEAPISGSFSRSVIDYVRTSGRRLAGVISTSDSWPHIGGVREYVAENVPIIALDLNASLLKRLIAAQFRSDPDSLARRPAKPRFQWITAPTELGEGSQRLRLIPLRSVTGERQIAIYWPAHRLLYTSDIMSPQGGGIWLPQYRSEVADMIERERLDVTTVFGMHYPPVAWASLQDLKAPAFE